MTSQRKLKGRVRARMAKTGESYVTARRALTSSPERPVTLAGGYALRGGMHPDTSAVANLLANTGTAGDDGSALSEAAVLGVGGGLGAGYILWEFAAHDTRAVVLGFRNQWQYPGRWMPKVLERLGLEHTLAETGGARRAAATLDEALDAGEPAIAWVDPVPLGYRHSPAWRRGRDGWPVVIAGRHGEDARGDRRPQPRADLRGPRPAGCRARERAVLQAPPDPRRRRSGAPGGSPGRGLRGRAARAGRAPRPRPLTPSACRPGASGGA